jgi:polysaccharide biosynthesis protein PslH
VVLSEEAATGISARSGEHFAVAQGDEALAQAVLALLDEPDRARALGAAARRFVAENVSWDAALAPLAGMLGGPAGTARHAA